MTIGCNAPTCANRHALGRDAGHPEGTTGPEHLALIENGSTKPLNFGRLFTTNADLPRRLATGAPVAQPDISRDSGGDETRRQRLPTLTPRSPAPKPAIAGRSRQDRKRKP